MNYKDRLKSWLEQARQTSEGMLASFKSPQEWTHQVHPNANHALWFAGHISLTDNFIVGVVAPDKKAEPPAGFKEKFGMGSKPSSNPTDYPPAEDVLGFLRDRRQALLAALDRLTENDLNRSLPKGAPDFIKDYADAFQMAIWHEGIHTGQLSIARRALGHAPLMGGDGEGP
jgi:hypothetical protein